jgi:hypothetical protein
VIQILQDQQTLLDDAVTFLAFEMGTKPTPQASCSLAGRTNPADQVLPVPSHAFLQITWPAHQANDEKAEHHITASISTKI